MVFAQFDSVATNKRLDSYSSNKAGYSAVAGNIFGMFRPVDPSQNTAALGISSQAYEFTTYAEHDIKGNDILTIDSLEYQVKGVSKYTMGGVRFLKCVLQLSVTE